MIDIDFVAEVFWVEESAKCQSVNKLDLNLITDLSSTLSLDLVAMALRTIGNYLFGAMTHPLLLKA